MKKILFSLLALAFSIQLFSQKPEYKVGAIGFYNFENLFDTLDTPNVRDTEFTPKGKNLYTPEVYQTKLDNLSGVIAELGTELTPDGLAILGVCEIENRSVLEDLVVHPNIADRAYKIVHYDSADKRGIDVGLIYQEKYYKVEDSRRVRLHIMKNKKDSYHHIMGTMGLAYTIVMSLSAVKFSSFTYKAIHLKNQNAQLLQNMEKKVEVRTQRIYRLSNIARLTGLFFF